MTNLHDAILAEFDEVQTLTGHKHPKTLTEIERSPTDDDEYEIPESRCRVDLFFRKNRGWR